MASTPHHPTPTRKGGGRLVLHWAPVWIPTILLIQVGFLGLRPAQDRSRELDRLTPEVHARVLDTQATHQDLEERVRAWDDPIFRARFRRSAQRRSLGDVDPPRSSSSRGATPMPEQSAGAPRATPGR